jgi:late competence protein required for DNA uptake (superfamily II DNA/RNA helicase)
MPKTSDTKSTAEKLADARQKSLDAAKKISLANQRALAAEAELAKLELEEARETISLESNAHRKQLIIGKMILSWLSIPDKKVTDDKLKEWVNEYLPPNSPDRKIFDLPPEQVKNQ